MVIRVPESTRELDEHTIISSFLHLIPETLDPIRVRLRDKGKLSRINMTLNNRAKANISSMANIMPQQT